MSTNVRGAAPEHYPPVESHMMRSRHVNQTFKVQVMLPACRLGEAARFPVVYATDGNFAFDALKGISYSMQTPERGVPRFILVGIGYPSESPNAGVMLRCRDMTFPGYPRLRMNPPPVLGVPLVEEGTKDFDGADDFQRFISDELIPFIDEKYETVPGDRTYFGHSAGGGFGLFTLFTQTELFENYIISSPAVRYHGKTSAGINYENYDFLLQDARRFVLSGKPLNGGRVYMSVGTEEEFEPNLVDWQLTSSFYRLSALLKAAAMPGLTLLTEALQGETHMTAWPIAFMHGIQAVFRTGSWSQL
jgi:predicted alpha/beta superfamily hydrolase